MTPNKDAIEKAIEALGKIREFIIQFHAAYYKSDSRDYWLEQVDAISCALQLLREYRAKQPSEGVWQDISTAPRDETEILVWLPERNDYFRTFWISFYWANKYGNGPAYQGDDVIKPTHWMPLPSPPQALQGAGG